MSLIGPRPERPEIVEYLEARIPHYRERLLVAFKEVETALSALRILDLQHESQLRAVNAAERAEQLATARYKAGLVNVLELVDAQRTRLQVERGRLVVRQQQMLARPRTGDIEQSALCFVDVVELRFVGGIGNALVKR
jgi:hypothetical protein